jgi:hypothetical protein
MRKIRVIIAAILIMYPLVCVLFLPVHARDSDACRALADLRIDDTNLLSAAVVPASGDLPEYCRILGYVRPAINFEIRLPPSNWNGKYYMAGCGAFCGKLNSDNPGTQNAINHGLRRNYAVSTTDGGHWGETPFDGRWAYHNRQAEIDFGYRAVRETARVTKLIIEAYYEQAPSLSYFDGCSNGGRQGVMAALRYPEVFDGIISGCPLFNVAEAVIFQIWLVMKNMGHDGKVLLTPADAGIISRAVYETCDGLDGLQDGLLSDPRTCTFDPESLLCADEEQTDCLDQEQIEALKALYDGPRNSAGERLFPSGLPFGSEPFWTPFIISNAEYALDNFMVRFTEEYLRYMAFIDDPGETYSITDFDFDRDAARMEFMSQIYSVDNPDLENFRKRGGKLLMWQAWSDPGSSSPFGAIEYYESVEAHSGGRDITQKFFRLFLIPGMGHCGGSGGPGITAAGFDPLTALERWVEHGEAPGSLLTTKTDEDGNILWTRPVCPFPLQAVYKGSGDINDASNFECVVI